MSNPTQAFVSQKPRMHAQLDMFIESNGSIHFNGIIDAGNGVTNERIDNPTEVKIFMEDIAAGRNPADSYYNHRI